MHFLSEVIKTPKLKDPFNNHKNIHRHFYRYSRGDFLGPALKITKTNARITLKSTHEYEDLILEIVARKGFCRVTRASYGANLPVDRAKKSLSFLASRGFLKEEVRGDSNIYKHEIDWLLRPGLLFEPVVCEDCKVSEVNLVVRVQVSRDQKRLVEDACAVGGCVGNLSLRKGIVVNSEIVN